MKFYFLSTVHASNKLKKSQKLPKRKQKGKKLTDEFRRGYSRVVVVILSIQIV